MKTCNKCGVNKSFDQFPKSSYTRDGLYSFCRHCKSIQNTTRAQANRDAVNSQARQRHAERMANDPQYVQKKRESSSKSRSKLENKDRINSTHREWCQKNRHLRRESDRKQRAKRRQVVPTEAELIRKPDIWERDQGVCGICQLPADADNWHLDHVTPLSRGGDHTHDNVQVSHPTCNLRKNNRLQDEMK